MHVLKTLSFFNIRRDRLSLIAKRRLNIFEVNVTAKLIQNQLLDLIKTRRSIRRFKPNPISDDQLLTILEAGRLAPTGENTCPWRFIVVKDPEKRKF